MRLQEKGEPPDAERPARGGDVFQTGAHQFLRLGGRQGAAQADVHAVRSLERRDQGGGVQHIAAHILEPVSELGPRPLWIAGQDPHPVSGCPQVPGDGLAQSAGRADDQHGAGHAPTGRRGWRPTSCALSSQTWPASASSYDSGLDFAGRRFTKY